MRSVLEIQRTAAGEGGHGNQVNACDRGIQFFTKNSRNYTDVLYPLAGERAQPSAQAGCNSLRKYCTASTVITSPKPITSATALGYTSAKPATISIQRSGRVVRFKAQP